MNLIYTQERVRFFRFMVVGAIGAVVDFGVMNFFIHVMNASVTISGIISFIAAVTSNYFWNRYWTYPESRSKHLIRQYGEFFLINALGLIIRIPILAFVDPPMRVFFNQLAIKTTFISPNDLGDNFTLAVAVLIVMFWNFFANRYWTFADVNN